MRERLKIGEILVRTGLIEEEQLRAALGEQARWGGRVGVTLVKMGFLSEEDLVRALGSHFGIPVVRLAGKRIPSEVLAMLPGDFAEKHACMPLFVHWENGSEVLFLGMEDPGDIPVIEDVRFRSGLEVRPVLVGPLQVRAAIEEFYRGVPGPDDSGYDLPVQFGDNVPERPAPAAEPPTAPVASPAPSAAVRAALSEAPVAEPEEGYEHTFESEADAEDEELPELDEVDLDTTELDAPVAPPVEVRASEPAAPPAAPARPAPRSRDAAPRAAAPVAAPAAGFGPGVSRMGPPERPRQVATRDILRAVTKLLIARGIFTRDDLIEAVRSVASEEGSGD